MSLKISPVKILKIPHQSKNKYLSFITLEMRWGKDIEEGEGINNQDLKLYTLGILECKKDKMVVIQMCVH